MSILEQLYNGNINPTERYVKKGSEYQSINKQLVDDIDKLLPLLNENGKALFEKVTDNIYTLSYITEKEAFIEGFRLGVQIINEIYRYENTQFESNL